MSRVFTEATNLDLQAKALEEPDNLVYVLFQYLTTYELPAKTLANAIGVAPQTLYIWADPKAEVRPTDDVNTSLRRVLEKLKAAENKGLLPLEGNFKQRAAALTRLLSLQNTVETGPM